MASHIHVEGSWPGSVELSAGWSRARARPWNETVSDPMLRLDRGGAEFLRAVTGRLIELGCHAVYSPALYPGSTRVWSRAGYDDFATLDIMERLLDGSVPSFDGVEIQTDPVWDQVLEIDRDAFEGFWGMSRLGLVEAHGTNRATVLLAVFERNQMAGYAIVGSQWGTVYLHRIAVRTEVTGRGHGASLLASAISWGHRSGGRSIILNVRPENTRAKGLYRRLGFTDTGTALRVLRHVPG